jgi:cell division septum initiation protein DivIVA
VASQDEIQGLYQRIAALEQSVQSLGSQAESGSGPEVQRLIQQVQQLSGDLQAINSKADSMMETLQATVGFGVRAVFACKSCEAQGHVATKLTCTSCGTEEWWGWLPPPQE